MVTVDMPCVLVSRRCPRGVAGGWYGAMGALMVLALPSVDQPATAADWPIVGTPRLC